MRDIYINRWALDTKSVQNYGGPFRHADLLDRSRLDLAIYLDPPKKRTDTASSHPVRASSFIIRIKISSTTFHLTKHYDWPINIVERLYFFLVFPQLEPAATSEIFFFLVFGPFSSSVSCPNYDGQIPTVNRKRNMSPHHLVSKMIQNPTYLLLLVLILQQKTIHLHGHVRHRLGYHPIAVLLVVEMIVVTPTVPINMSTTATPTRAERCPQITYYVPFSM